MTLSIDSPRLKSWFLHSKRDLPWRDNPNPYSVWISEVMLQQTQVSVVIPYFLRWMVRFPTIESLARSSIDEVIKLWEGLGYYSRARNLHEGAKQILREFDGNIPHTYEELIKIKGLGPYTIGAILSFAFRQRASAVDGNVIRVLTRYFLIEDDIAKPKTISKIRDIAESVLPEQDSWIFNEAMIELGATLCMRKPKCQECPLRRTCQSFLQGKTDSIPFKSKKIKIEKLYRTVAVIRHENMLLVKRGNSGQIMNDLHEFPYIETDEKRMNETELEKNILMNWNLPVTSLQLLPEVSHSFTRFRVRLNPILMTAPVRQEVEHCQWISLTSLKKLAFSSGHRRIFENLQT